MMEDVLLVMKRAVGRECGWRACCRWTEEDVLSVEDVLLVKDKMSVEGILSMDLGVITARGFASWGSEFPVVLT